MGFPPSPAQNATFRPYHAELMIPSHARSISARLSSHQIVLWCPLAATTQQPHSHCNCRPLALHKIEPTQHRTHAHILSLSNLSLSVFLKSRPGKKDVVGHIVATLGWPAQSSRRRENPTRRDRSSESQDLDPGFAPIFSSTA